MLQANRRMACADTWFYARENPRFPRENRRVQMPPPGYEFLDRSGWPYSPRYAARVGVRAAARLAYPALAALTESCAECNVLAAVVEESGERLTKRLKPLCEVRNLSPWRIAVIHVRQFLGILRERHRYVL